MECTECGADVEADAKFCTRCAAPVAGASGARQPVDDARREEDDEHAAADDDDEEDESEGDPVVDEEVAIDPRTAVAPSRSPAQAARTISLGVALLATMVIGIVRLANRPTVRIETIDPPDLGDLGAAPVTEAPTILREAHPAREPTESERTLAGTWVARVGFDAPRPASMGSTLVQIKALRSGLAAPTERCVWLELYANLRGFQHECGVIDGEPSVLERAALGSRPRALGVGLRWSFEDGRLSITYDEEMTVTAAGRTARFTQTVLTLPAGTSPFDVQQSFPEHPDMAPLAPRFEVFAGSYLEDEGSREAP